MTTTLRHLPTTQWSNSHDTGWHDTADNRAAVRAAADRITWTDRPYSLPQLQQPPVRVLVGAIFYGRPGQLCAAGTAPVEVDGKQHTLVGLADACNRYYLLDLGAEAVYVLHESRVAR